MRAGMTMPFEAPSTGTVASGAETPTAQDCAHDAEGSQRHSPIKPEAGGECLANVRLPHCEISKETTHAPGGAQLGFR
jgi:hypothetical protein